MARRKKKQQIVIPTKLLIALIIIAVIIVVVCMCIPSVRQKVLEIASVYIGFEDENTSTNSPSGKEDKNKTDKINDGTEDCLAYVTIIDVDQGDAIYVLFPDGKDMLIDGGKGDKNEKAKLMTYLENTVTDGFIDYVFLTHTDKDHCGGLDDVFKTYDVGAVYMPYITASYGQENAAYIQGTCSTKTYYDFYTAATTETYVKDGQEYECEVNYNIGNFTISGENYSFDVYGKEQSEYEAYYYKSSKLDPNDYSPIVICEIYGVKICFTGDAHEGVEDDFIKNYKGDSDVDILKVGHHGSKYSSDTDFLEFLSPEYALISVGAVNDYNHPNPEALQRLEQEDITVYRTDEKGDIKVKIYDGTFSFEFAGE